MCPGSLCLFHLSPYLCGFLPSDGNLLFRRFLRSPPLFFHPTGVLSGPHSSPSLPLLTEMCGHSHPALPVLSEDTCARQSAFLLSRVFSHRRSRFPMPHPLQCTHHPKIRLHTLPALLLTQRDPYRNPAWKF